MGRRERRKRREGETYPCTLPEAPSLRPPTLSFLPFLSSIFFFERENSDRAFSFHYSGCYSSAFLSPSFNFSALCGISVTDLDVQLRVDVNRTAIGATRQPFLSIDHGFRQPEIPGKSPATFQTKTWRFSGLCSGMFLRKQLKHNEE